MFLRTKTKKTMKNLYDEMPNGYQESIQKGLSAVRYFSRNMSFGTVSREEQIDRLKQEIEAADAIVIGAGAGLSTSAGLTYSGERFERYFFDFARKWWARHIYFNRYIDAPKPVYQELLSLVKDKDYFVVTTNVDHQFQRAGFDKKRLFYTQGDYGLFQSVNPLIQKTYDNEEWVMKAMEAQGFVKDEHGIFQVPEDGILSMKIPTALIPKCPDEGSDVTMNLRADDSFVEDEGWHRASAAYADFLLKTESLQVLYLELGVGANTPVIVKYPFWQMTLANEKSVYACINYGEAFCPGEIANRSICIDGDIGDVFAKIK